MQQCLVLLGVIGQTLYEIFFLPKNVYPQNDWTDLDFIVLVDLR